MLSQTAPFFARHPFPTAFGEHIWEWVVIAIIAVTYLATLTPGHPIPPDDYAAYIMHASNLVEGRPYADLHLIPNPEAAWFVPANGYPPVYPLLLAPIYKFFGLNLWAMKVLTVCAFIVFLVLFVFFMGSSLPSYMRVIAVSLLGFHPFFWKWKDLILSDLPYMMFSFAALLVIRYFTANVNPDHWNVPEAFCISVFLYCAYGIRTIGITLLAALVLAHLVKCRRPTRFLWLVLLLTGISIALQSWFLNSPRTYINLTDFSPAGIFRRWVFYGKTLSYVWANGVSKETQIIFALLFTWLALVRFARRMWTDQSVVEIYLLGYLAVLMIYSSENGYRFLMPILPLYIFYGLQELTGFLQQVSRRARLVLTGALVLAVALMYWGHFVQESREKPWPNVRDASFRELCSFLQKDTQPTDIIATTSPRTMALFTNRTVTVLGPSESPEQSSRFLKKVRATILIQADWAPLSWGDFVASDPQGLTEIFHNSDYKVFRIKPAEEQDCY